MGSYALKLLQNAPLRIPILNKFTRDPSDPVSKVGEVMDGKRVGWEGGVGLDGRRGGAREQGRMGRKRRRGSQSWGKFAETSQRLDAPDAID
jgi:hypothetical protein